MIMSKAGSYGFRLGIPEFASVSNKDGVLDSVNDAQFVLWMRTFNDSRPSRKEH